MKLRSTQRLTNDDGAVIMGNGRLNILESIERTGSINQTAKELKMAYKTVWSKIKTTEQNFGKSVVMTDKIEGTKLTPEGRDLIERFRELKSRCQDADDLIFEKIFPARPR